MRLSYASSLGSRNSWVMESCLYASLSEKQGRIECPVMPSGSGARALNCDWLRTSGTTRGSAHGRNRTTAIQSSSVSPASCACLGGARNRKATIAGGLFIYWVLWGTNLTCPRPAGRYSGLSWPGCFSRCFVSNWERTGRASFSSLSNCAASISRYPYLSAP